jgi:hypothetical protein
VIDGGAGADTDDAAFDDIGEGGMGSGFLEFVLVHGGVAEKWNGFR